MAIAELDPGQQDRLVELLGRCVVRIRAGGLVGTGFFIAPGQVLTCRHVVARAIDDRTTPISVEWFRRSGEGAVALDATIAWRFEADWPDIAILDVPEASDAPCVMLDSAKLLSDTPLVTAGYPVGATAVPFQANGFTAGYYGHGEGPERELRITDDRVGDGTSGSPIVNLKSGLVVGYVRIGKSGALGGFGTIFADITEQVPQVRSLADIPPPAAREWIRFLGSIRLKELERDRNTGARWGQIPVLPRIDLTVEQVSATPGEWQIGVTRARNSAVLIGRKTADLGDGVIWAVDGWSRRRMFQHLDEVKILGEVLDRALIPDAARTAMENDMTAPPLLLRVCVDKAGGLSQLPWEYACGEGAEPLSVNRDIAFARFVPKPGDPPAPKERLRILTVIEMPQDGPQDEPQKFREYSDEDGRDIEPSADEFQRSVREVLQGNERVSADYVLNGSSAALRDKLSEEWDIVHYVGFCWQIDDEPVVSLGSSGMKLRAVGISELREDYLALAHCAVFVAEFHQLPFNELLLPPSDLSTLCSLLRDDLHAIVVTRHPIDVVDLRRFNESFYERVTNGDIVELAVQSGRRAVQNGRHKGRDETAFGSFTVTTRQAGEVRLLKPRPSPLGIGRQSGPAEAAVAERVAVPQGLDSTTAVTGD